MTVPVSVQVCTLNEASNISDCLELIRENRPTEIVVIDGGSTDDTVAKAREFGVRVIESEGIGLANQRRQGFLNTDLPYVAFVDADDRLPANWLTVMYREAVDGQYAALQSCLGAFEPKNFWERGWDNYLRASISPSPDTLMVGRPAIYRREALLELPAPSGNLMEDTEMSIQFQRQGQRQGIANIFSYRICDASSELNFHKWRNYGKGYRNLARKFPDRRAAILRHMLWRIPIQRSKVGLIRSNYSQPLFQVLMAGAVLRGFLSSDGASQRNT